MTRKRKSKRSKASGGKTKRSKKRKTKSEKLSDKCSLDSVWRVQTADVETTSTDKEVLSGWKRCKIVGREDASADYPNGSVTVQYFDDDPETDEPIKYDLITFLSSADAAPVHIDLVNDETAVCLSREHPDFNQQERGELLPVERRQVSNPKEWKKNSRKFDNVKESDFNKDEETCIYNMSMAKL